VQGQTEGPEDWDNTYGHYNPHGVWPPAQVSTSDQKGQFSGVPTILCSINRRNFYNTIYDTRLGVNIMAKVTYEFLYGTMPLDPTYAQL